MANSPLVLSFSIDIEAPVERVWDVITDLARYEEWNPFVVGVRGQNRPSPGGEITLDVRMPGGRRTMTPERVVELSAPGTVGRFSYKYVGGMRWIGMVSAHREQMVQDLGQGRTRYSTKECMGGWLWRLLPAEQIRQGLQISGEALRLRCESTQ